MILAIDTGLGSLGWALVSDGHVFNCGAQLLPVIDGESVHDGFQRRVHEQVRGHLARVGQCDAIVAESLSFARSSKAVAAVSLCWGALVAVAHMRGLALTAVTPKEWQHALAGRKGKVDQSQLADRIERFVCRTSSRGASALAQLSSKQMPHALDACGIGIYATRVARKAQRG